MEAEQSEEGLVSVKQRLQNISADLDSLDHLAANVSAAEVELRREGATEVEPGPPPMLAQHRELVEAAQHIVQEAGKTSDRETKL